VRDDRPWGGPCATGAQSDNLSNCAGRAPPGAVYYFSTDRKGEHPQSHLAKFEGILQAPYRRMQAFACRAMDAFSGYKKLYELDAAGAVHVREAACWAHLRRDFHDVWTTTKSEIAREALDRIGALYDIEREITGQSAEQRKAVRQKLSGPKVEAFKSWAEVQLGRIPGKGDLAKAFRYGLKRWPSFSLFLDDGRVAIDNNAAERAIKPVVIPTRAMGDSQQGIPKIDEL